MAAYEIYLNGFLWPPIVIHVPGSLYWQNYEYHLHKRAYPKSNVEKPLEHKYHHLAKLANITPLPLLSLHRTAEPAPILTYSTMSVATSTKNHVLPAAVIHSKLTTASLPPLATNEALVDSLLQVITNYLLTTGPEDQFVSTGRVYLRSQIERHVEQNEPLELWAHIPLPSIHYSKA